MFLLLMLLAAQEEPVTLTPVHKGAAAYDALGIVRVSFSDAIVLGEESFTVEPKDDGIAIDTDRDGRVDTFVPPKGAFVALKRSAGVYAVRIESIMTKKGGEKKTRSWLYRTGTLMIGKHNRKSVALLDANGNGRFDDRQADAIIFGKKKVPLDARVPNGKTLWEVKPAVDGSSVVLRDTGKKAPKIRAGAKVVKMINELRAAVGVAPVTVDGDLSKGCQKHVRYLHIVGYGKKRGLNPHAEDSKVRGYSKEGEAAARNSYLGWGHRSLEAFYLGNLQTWYHRINFVCPDLNAVGVATSGGISAIDIGSGRVGFASLSSPIVLPYDGMKDVARNFQNESPNPIKGGRDPNSCGVAIQCIFPDGSTVTDAKIFVEDQYGVKIGGFVNTPEEPFETLFALDHVVGLIPRDALAESTKYYITVTCTWNEKPYVREWSFTTASK